jgi:hypothetical protein
VIDRVLVSEEGDAVTLARALSMDIRPDYVFERNDGWILSAPWHLAKAAQSLWEGHWVKIREVTDKDFEGVEPEKPRESFRLRGAL